MSSKQVDISIPPIEKELDKLWKEAADKKQMKACLFTLVIYASEADRVVAMQEIVDNILDKFPCRIIFIKEEARQEEGSFFHVNISTVMSGNVKQKSTIACDQITINCSKDQLFRVPFLVLPHLVPDLPVYLLWGENPFKEHVIFPFLKAYSARTLFDSDSVKEIHVMAHELLETASIEIIDLNWAMMSNWRDVFLSIFNTVEKFADLAICKSIIINYNSEIIETIKHPEIRPIYLQAWLASQLGWNYMQCGQFYENFLITYAYQNHPIVVALSPQPHLDCPPGSIGSIEITLLNGNTYTIIRKANLPQVTVHMATKVECLMPYTIPLPNVHRGLSFLQEIFFKKPSAQYVGMLKKVSEVDFSLFKHPDKT